MTAPELRFPAQETAPDLPVSELTRRVSALVAALQKAVNSVRGSEAQRAKLIAEVSTLKSKLEESKRELAVKEEVQRRLSENQDRLNKHVRSSARRDIDNQLTVKDVLPPDTDLYYRQQAEITRLQDELTKKELEISTIRSRSLEKKNILRVIFKQTPLRRIVKIFRGRSRRVANERNINAAHLTLICDSGIFDAQYYLAQYPDVKRAALDPAKHYLLLGGFEGRKPHPLFDSKFYLTAYNEAAEQRVNPLVHFLLSGAKQNRNPNPLFFCDFYRESNPDIAASGANELAHYIKYGAWEGRDPNPFFDSEYYLKQHPDLREKNITPLQHYIETGWREGTNPHPLFWGNFYIETNTDVAQGVQTPLCHFLKFGNPENRDPNPLLHGCWYLETHPDAITNGALTHFVTTGSAELLDPSPFFSTAEYLTIHPQLLSSGRSALEDILERARAEFSELPKPWPTPLRLWWRDIWRTIATDESLAVTPKVSVIIPCFNQGNFLEDAVLSVLISKVAVEVIVVDDGSTDRATVDEITRVENIYPIKVIHRANGGLAAARNTGLAAASADFIQFLDCDDVVFPEKLSRQLSHFESRPELAASVCEYHLSNVYLSSWYSAQPSTLSDFALNHQSFLNCWERGLSIPIHCALFRRKLLGSIRFNETVRAKEDWLFWLDVSKQNSVIELLSEPLAIYRLHGENMSRNIAEMGREFLRAAIHISQSENPNGFMERAVEHYHAYYLPQIQAQAKKQQKSDASPL